MTDTPDVPIATTTTPEWRFGPERTALPLDRPVVMAVLNVTPDSFSDGGELDSPERAADAAARAADAGAELLDVGGESTRPGAERVGAGEQIRRVVPAIGAIRARALRTPDGRPVRISVDTTRADVARAALDAGAEIINDVAAGAEDPGILALAAERGAGVILMHRLRPPDADRYSDRYDTPPEYEDVVRNVARFLDERARAAREAGVPLEAIALDPGLGFGKSVEQNLELIRRTGELAALGRPIISALSRKSFVGRVSRPGAPPAPAARLAGTLALTVMHRLAGAHVFRVHDPGPAMEALRATEAARA